MRSRGLDKRVSLLLSEEILRDVEEWRRRQEKIPSLNEAIRQLLVAKLKEEREGRA
jgi:hypothetical protein